MKDKKEKPTSDDILERELATITAKTRREAKICLNCPHPYCLQDFGRACERVGQKATAKKWKIQPVEQYTLSGKFVKRWKSAIEAQRVLGIHNKTISNACKSVSGVGCGYIWRFLQI